MKVTKDIVHFLSNITTIFFLPFYSIVTQQSTCAVNILEFKYKPQGENNITMFNIQKHHFKMMPDQIVLGGEKKSLVQFIQNII